jgi:aspartyl/asparaginyl-tRNA synthetase
VLGGLFYYFQIYFGAFSSVFAFLQVSAVDLLVPGVGELIGGSLREDDANILSQRLQDLKLLEQFAWYVKRVHARMWIITHQLAKYE